MHIHIIHTHVADAFKTLIMTIIAQVAKGFSHKLIESNECIQELINCGTIKLHFLCKDP